ncbi:hypothetical protein MTR67_025793 [Solanum verrucosum]|uniref:Uncharacterized protein n=1 Tax=Solanum verrucosum TaxID=315347 RepID=A0AAF0TZI3_SOLVR|nr:hypothetical protein MTR67_025793 [Solanum verrucosum]
MPQLNLAKLKLNTENRKRNMYVVLRECGLTTNAAELKIENRYMHDLEAEDLNLHHEKI